MSLTEEQLNSAIEDVLGVDPIAIVEAAKILAEDHSITETLLGLLKNEISAASKQGIYYALTWHGKIELWDLMTQTVADQSEHPKVRGQAAEALAYMFHLMPSDSAKFAHGVQVLLNVLKDPSPEVRYCALFALGASKDISVIPALEALIADRNPVEGWGGTVGEEAKRALESLR